MEKARQLLSKVWLLLLVPLVFVLAVVTDIVGIQFTSE